MTSFLLARGEKLQLLDWASVAYGLPFNFSPVGSILQARNIVGWYQEN
jgi:hypothetical protein